MRYVEQNDPFLKHEMKCLSPGMTVNLICMSASPVHFMHYSEPQAIIYFRLAELSIQEKRDFFPIKIAWPFKKTTFALCSRSSSSCIWRYNPSGQIKTHVQQKEGGFAKKWLPLLNIYLEKMCPWESKSSFCSFMHVAVSQFLGLQFK